MYSSSSCDGSNYVPDAACATGSQLWMRGLLRGHVRIRCVTSGAVVVQRLVYGSISKSDVQAGLSLLLPWLDR